MPDRHSELPAHPDLEYYRKQAEHLQRTYATGDAAAQARVADVLGLNPDVTPYLGRTGLHWAILHSHLGVVRLLLERGADPSIRDELFYVDADGWLHMLYATRWHDPVTQQLHDLIESRSRQA
jgi:hypothetical protein